MADVPRALLKQLLHLALQQRFVKVNVYRKLSAGARQLGVGSQIGHPNPPLINRYQRRERIQRPVFRKLDKLLRVALSSCDARCTKVQLRFSDNIAAARDASRASFKKKEYGISDRTGDYTA
ncbi:hypothetical protein [Massilia sp. AB1]|uniref:hypothetical protein n=1 Tax=Massilia sp. AB1 TaxID=2823371 RepID=UPI001E61A6E1|nr:hypothetical protein [Massilia sp. AB1]